ATITFVNLAGDKLHLSYQQVKQLIDLKKKLDLLTPAQSEALFQRCCDKNKEDVGSDEAEEACLNDINSIRDSWLGRLMNNDDIRPADQVNWNQAFSVPEETTESHT